jgi:hypothetical protein
MRAELGGETVSVGRAGIDAMTATTVDTMSGAVERHAVGWLSRTDIERTVEGLYRKIALPADDSKRLALKTAGNVWVLVTKMFDDAVNAKAREHRVRSDNPASGVRGPERGAIEAVPVPDQSKRSSVPGGCRNQLRFRRVT